MSELVMFRVQYLNWSGLFISCFAVSCFSYASETVPFEADPGAYDKSAGRCIRADEQKDSSKHLPVLGVANASGPISYDRQLTLANSQKVSTTDADSEHSTDLDREKQRSSNWIALGDVDAQLDTGSPRSDATGDVGHSYYIQGVNARVSVPMSLPVDRSHFAIYDKTDLSLTAGPFSINSLGDPAVCGNNLDPVVVYDEMASRWILGAFGIAESKFCLYVSRTSDPVNGGWYEYILTAGGAFPDYPKLAVGRDAYYLSTNNGFDVVSKVYALNRTAALNGQSLGQVPLFDVQHLPNIDSFQLLLPADSDGNLPPRPDLQGLFFRQVDDEASEPACADPKNDFIEMFELTPNFDNVALSTFTGPTRFPIAEFDMNFCANSNCVPQRQTTQKLKSIASLLMSRVAYRRFASHESIIGTFDDGTAESPSSPTSVGTRWWELRRPIDGTWSLYQEGTASGSPKQSRWFSASSMDKLGNTAVSYSFVDTELSQEPGEPIPGVGIKIIGREASDPLGQMTLPELTLTLGDSSFGDVDWGDYSALNVDPSDDCTIFVTNQYAVTPSEYRTRIGKYQIASCTNFVDTDTDGDGVTDSFDNCTSIANPMQRDTDGDGYGNFCDADLNGDCIVNTLDLALLKAVFFSNDVHADLNGDGSVNTIDLGIMASTYFTAPGASGVFGDCD